MPKSKEQKKDFLDKLKDKLSKSKSVVFSSDTGLNVKTSQALRQELKQSGAEYLVAKKTLLKLATKDLDDNQEMDNLKGSVGVILSYEDEIAGPRVLNKFAEENETLELGGGILEGSFIMPDIVKRLANLPSRKQLLANLVGSLKSPIVGMVGVLGGTTRSFVQVLNAIKDNKSN